MRNRLIYWLGGYTKGDFDNVEDENEELRWELQKAETTIEELSALIPKKRGSSRKYAKAN